jgi:hypothetical protein
VSAIPVPSTVRNGCVPAESELRGNPVDSKHPVLDSSRIRNSTRGMRVLWP